MRDHFARVVRQIHEQVKFLWSEVNGAIFYKNAARSGIDLEIARVDRLQF